MSNFKELNRRELLKFLGLGGAATALSPLAMLTESIVSGVANRAYAQTAGINPRMFLYIQLPGAPQRWVYDLFLNPYNSSGFTANAQVVTRYIASGGRYTSAEYATTTVKGIQAPWMWQFSLPTPGGGTRPMADLLDNLLALQGVDSGSDSHEIARNSIFLPLGSLQSINALSSDYSSAPIKGVQHSVSDYVFRSLKGFSSVSVSGTNLLTSLMDPFTNRTSATFTTKKNNLKNYLDAATQALSDQARIEHPGSVTIEADRKTASDLLAQAVGDMNTFWTNGVAKYRDLIRRAIDPTQMLTGISDLPVGTDQTRDGTYRISDTVIANDPDLRAMLDTTLSISRLAEEFTLAEYLFMNNLSHSLSINPSRLGIRINGSSTSVQSDEHSVGRMVSLISNTYHYRAFSACLLELITRLRAANVFNNTVIAIAGDFARSPRNDGLGSDHGRYASHMVYYSGAIQGPIILGRTRANTTSGGHSGTWGEGDRTRDYGNLLVSTATMLRVPSPLTARTSMVAEQNGVITATAERSTLF